MFGSGLNYKAKIASFVGRVLGSKALQPILDKTQVLLFGAMNVGGATYSYEHSGEADVMRAIKDSYDSTKELTIFDVGAHRGDYAETLRCVFGKRAEIFCFEPSDQLFSQLKANLTTNGFRVYMVGLGDENSEMSLFTSEDLIPTVFRDSYEITGQTLLAEEKITTVRLDTFCREEKVSKIDFLKIDVEGFEYRVLLGAGDIVANGEIDFIQFEFGPHCIASRTYMNDFFRLLNPNYRIFRILRKGLYELPSYSPKLEIFASATNYLAVLRTKRFGGV